MSSTRSVRGHDCAVIDDGTYLVGRFRLVASLQLPLDPYILMKKTVFTIFLRFAEHEGYARTGSVCRDLQQFLFVRFFFVDNISITVVQSRVFWS